VGEGRGEGIKQLKRTVKFMSHSDHDHDHHHEPETLDSLLEKAATEPAYRPAFFRKLLESTVWVPGTAAEDEAIVEDSALDLQHWEKDDGQSVIPFFTSLEALQQAVETEQAFVVMPARTLFEMTLGETLFLNAKLPTGKELTPREISHLVGKDDSPLSQQEVLEGGHVAAAVRSGRATRANDRFVDQIVLDLQPREMCLSLLYQREK